MFRNKTQKMDNAASTIEDKRKRRILVFLALLTGGGLGIAFPPFQLGVLACFALVPLLLIFELTDGFARPLRYTYLAFFTLQAVSVYWMGGFVHGQHTMQMVGGALLLFVHPFFFFVPVAGYLLIRRTFGPIYALAALPFIWIGFEYVHSIGDLAFPWHTLGNTQSYDIVRAQFITMTGVYGLSFWIVVINVLAFVLAMKIAAGAWKPVSRPALGTAALIVAVHFIPFVYGSIVLSHEQTYDEQVHVGIVQPDTDPFEKWGLNPGVITRQLISQSEQLVAEEPDIIIFPENAVPYYLMLPQNAIHLDMLREFIDESGIPLLTGLPYARIYDAHEVAPPTAKEIESTGQRYESFNAAVFLQPERDGYGFYGKIVLVPFVEKIPYGDLIPFAVHLRRSVGVGGWDVGPDTTVFEFTAGDGRRLKFGTVICYESVYPGFVRHFTNKGADFLVIITNDSWWGRTPGPRQHLQMSVFRAIENRRSIARSANGGISAFIDPYGRILYETELFVQTQTAYTIPISGQTTFYAKHGDVFSMVCLLLGVLPITAAAGERMRKRIYAQQDRIRGSLNHDNNLE
jgi:apolipoprotein N-acyltransferase